MIDWSKYPYSNPYSAGNPIKSEEMFFGRDELFEKAHAHLDQNPNHPIIIYGQRRMGKTSVLYHMQRRLNALSGCERYATVLLDLQGFSLRGSDDFWEDMAAYIHFRLKHDYQLPKPDLTLFESDYKIAFREHFLPMVQSAIGERRLVLMFDESLRFEEVVIQERLPFSIFDDLRQLMQNEAQISFIYSLASPVSTLLPEFQKMFKDALTLHVTYFSQKVARALVTEPVAEFCEFSDAAIRYLLAFSGNHPYFTQAVCETLFLRFPPATRITCADILSIRGDVTNSTMNNLGYLWIEATVAEKFVLAAIAQLKPSVDMWALERHLRQAGIYLNKAHIKRALKGLHQREIIDSTTHPRIHLGILRDWLRYAKSLDLIRGQFYEYLPPMMGNVPLLSPALTAALTKPWIREPAQVSLALLAGINRSLNR
jgi:hypothetical protein